MVADLGHNHSRTKETDCALDIFPRYIKIWLKSCRRKDRESQLFIDIRIPVGCGYIPVTRVSYPSPGGMFSYRRDGLALNQDVSKISSSDVSDITFHPGTLSALKDV